MAKEALTYSVVDGMMDEKNDDIDELKQEIAHLNEDYLTLKKQPTDTRFKAMEKKYNELLQKLEREEKEQKARNEQLKIKWQERREKTKGEVQRFIAEMRARRGK